MRSLSKISLAVLAVSFLVVAGSAFAQDSGMQKPTLQITGIFNAGFGLENFDKIQNSSNAGGGTSVTSKAYSEWVTSYEHRIRFIYGTDDLQGRLVLRNRGSSSASNNACNTSSGVNASAGGATNPGLGGCPGTNSSGSGATNPSVGAAGTPTTQSQPAGGGSPFLQDIYGTLTWKPIKALGIEFGRFEGVAGMDPIAGTYNMSNPVFSGNDYWMNWTNADGINIAFDAGILTAGVGVSSKCIPRCSTGNYQVSGTFQNTQTITPWINGKVGDLGFRAQIPMTSGDISVSVDGNGNPIAPGTAQAGGAQVSTTTRSVSGSGYDVGVSFSGVPGMVIAVDAQNFVVAKDTKLCQATTTNSCKDWARDAIVFKFEFQGLQVGYFDQNTDDGKGATNSKQEDQLIKVHYMFPVGPGVVGPEYSQGTFGKRSLTSAGVIGSGAYDGTYKDITNSVIRLVGKVTF